MTALTPKKNIKNTQKMKIDKAKPMPRTSAKLGVSKYPFKKLKVGDSFAVEEGKRFSVATLAKKFGDSQEPIMQFSVRMDDKGQMTCWRVK